MKYIAYGINMIKEDMARRCPGARLIGTGTLRDTVYEFRGCATLRHCETDEERERHSNVSVAIWEIGAKDEEALDWLEGYPSYYRKEMWTAVMEDGSEIEGMIYLMNTDDNRNPISPPSAHYYAAIAQAYIKLGLKDHISVLDRAARYAQEVGV